MCNFKIVVIRYTFSIDHAFKCLVFKTQNNLPYRMLFQMESIWKQWEDKTVADFHFVFLVVNSYFL